MKPRVIATLSAVLLSVWTVGAAELPVSGQAGIYAVVERVVFEPATGVPERIQIWGAFAVMERMSYGFTSYAYKKPQRGYMYFTLPPVRLNDVENARREWNDLQSIAGKKQAVAFGYWDNYQGERFPTVRSEEVNPANPDTYRVDIGLTKLSTGMPGGTVEGLLKLVEGR